MRGVLPFRLQTERLELHYIHVPDEIFDGKRMKGLSNYVWLRSQPRHLGKGPEPPTMSYVMPRYLG